jgi:hypothetical protein
VDQSLAAPQGLQGLKPPPREVPLGIKLTELFGGTNAFIGWFFLLVGLPFAWIFAANGDYSGWRYHGALQTATARASACRGTNFSEGGSNHRRGHPVYETEFFFQDSGRTIVSSSYGWDCYQAGQDAPVEFPPGRPDLARVRGMRRALMPPSVVFVLIFPLIGLIFVVVSLRTGLRDIRLLQIGVVGRGTVVGKRATNTRVNNRILYELDMAFKDAFGKTARFKTRTCFPEVLEAEGAHNVFYDPDRPEDAIAVDTLPESLRADYSGGLASEGWGPIIRALVVPALVLLSNAAILAYKLTR